MTSSSIHGSPLKRLWWWTWPSFTAGHSIQARTGKSTSDERGLRKVSNFRILAKQESPMRQLRVTVPRKDACVWVLVASEELARADNGHRPITKRRIEGRGQCEDHGHGSRPRCCSRAFSAAVQRRVNSRTGPCRTARVPRQTKEPPPNRYKLTG